MYGSFGMITTPPPFRTVSAHGAVSTAFFDALATRFPTVTDVPVGASVTVMIFWNPAASGGCVSVTVPPSTFTSRGADPSL